MKTIQLNKSKILLQYAERKFFYQSQVMMNKIVMKTAADQADAVEIEHSCLRVSVNLAGGDIAYKTCKLRRTTNNIFHRRMHVE